MGGKSPEYEISLISGREVVKNLDTQKFTVLPVVVSRSGDQWQLTSPQTLLSLPDPLLLRGTRQEYLSKTLITRQSSGLKEMGESSDVVFIAMHGPYGEDGTIQGMLELTGLTYTGSGVAASALGMDKLLFRKVLAGSALPIPKYLVVEKGQTTNLALEKLGKFPYFVKPHNQGSSVGASLAKNKKTLIKALKTAFAYSDHALIDEYVKGTEVTCAIIGNEHPLALPLVEIVPKKGEFFNYESKYTERGADEIVPARISRKLTKKIQVLAKKVYQTLGCRGFARVDFIIKNGEIPIVLEINTIPGLTPMSLLPKAAKAAGISYRQLLTKIITYAYQKMSASRARQSFSGGGAMKSSA